MSTNILNKSNQDVVVFHFWKSLSYYPRLALSLGLILTGFILQFYMLNLIPGIFVIFVGNIFLLVKGYHNKVKVGKFDP